MTQEKLKEHGFDPRLIIDDIKDPQMRQRRIVSKILHASSVIAMSTRIGPAKYIVIDESILPERHIEIIDGKKMIAGFEILPHEDPTIIVVGRDEDKIEIVIKNV